MALRVSFVIESPIEFKRIANGERIIEQTAMDDIEIKIVDDGSDEEESPFMALHTLLDEFEKNERRSKRKKRNVFEITGPKSVGPDGSKPVKDELLEQTESEQGAVSAPPSVEKGDRCG